MTIDRLLYNMNIVTEPELRLEALQRKNDEISEENK